MNGFANISTFFFPLFFIGIWCAVLRILSAMSGWTQLAEQFHHPETFRGKIYRFQSARMKGVSFNNVLNIGVDETGLHLVPMVLFRLFHRPLLIPWAEIDAEPIKKFGFRCYRLTFRSCPNITLLLSHRTFEKMIAHLESRTSSQPPPV